MAWLLFTLTASGAAGFGDAQLFWMPEAQCKAAFEEIESLQRALAAVCITPDGEVVGWK